MAQFYYNGDSEIFPEKIISDRLEFKRIQHGIVSIDDIYKKYSQITNEETKYVTFSSYSNRKEVSEFIDDQIERYENNESVGYFMFLNDSGDFIGTTEFHPLWDQSIAESPIFLFKEFWGNGYSTERGEVMLELAFEELDFDYWISRCHPDNKGSIKSIEKYVVGNGGEKVGVLPNWIERISEDGYDDLLYFKLSNEKYNSV